MRAILQLLRRPRWAIGGVIVIVASVGFATAGLWQLTRLDERRVRNVEVELARAVDPVPVSFDALPLPTFTRVTADGSWVGEAEVALPLQIRAGMAGVHLLTPLRTEGGTVLVDRGWVPLDDVASYPRASGAVAITATVSAVRSGAATGGTEGGRPAVSAADPAAVAAITDTIIEPVALQLVSESPAQEPAPLPPLPEQLGEGNHLLYAIQWFSFIGIVLIGYAALLRRSARSGEVGDDLHPG